MNEANLLIDLKSFRWDDLRIDRSKQINNLIAALNQIIDAEDNIYNHPDSYNCKLTWGYFHSLLSFDEDEINLFIPWLTHNYQKTLINIFSRSITKLPSFNLLDLNNEFPNENNGMLGITPSDTEYVSCKVSWLTFHSNYVQKNYNIRNTNPKYFKKFYKPLLRTPPNQIQDLIDKGLVDPLFKRIDSPFQVADGTTLHGEDIQMHFNDKNNSALNIDGTWKHKKFILPARVKSQLFEWGFLLPDE